MKKPSRETIEERWLARQLSLKGKHESNTVKGLSPFLLLFGESFLKCGGGLTWKKTTEIEIHVSCNKTLVLIYWQACYTPTAHMLPHTEIRILSAQDCQRCSEREGGCSINREKWFPIKINKKWAGSSAWPLSPLSNGQECVLLWTFIKLVRFGTLLPEIRISRKIFPHQLWLWTVEAIGVGWQRNEPPWSSHWTWSVITSYEMNLPEGGKHSLTL